MNILMLSRNLAMNGVAACVVDFSNTLAEKGHRVCICARDGVMAERLRPEITFAPTVFHGIGPVTALRNLRQLYRLVKEEHIDVIHCHYRVTTLYARILHLLTGVDCIWQNQTTPIPHDPLHRFLTYHGKQAVAISQESALFLKEKMRIPEHELTKIENGIRVERYQRRSEEECRALRANYGIRQGEKVILLFGRLVSVKGHGFLLEAVKDLPGEYKVLFTGEGPAEYRREVEEHIRRLGLSKRVVFTGNVDPSDILSISDVMVLPSVQEGFGLTAIEAMALRVPVVRTKTGGYKDMKDCVDGVDYGDTATLTALLQKNLEHGPEIRQRVDYAYEKLMERWDLNAVMDRYLEIYAI